MVSDRISLMGKAEDCLEDGLGDVINTDWNHSLLVQNQRISKWCSIKALTSNPQNRTYFRISYKQFL